MASLVSPVLLVVSGLLALGGGLGLLSVTDAQAGSTLVLGGVLLVISALGVAVEPRASVV